jgi:hypothetical protein
MEDILASIRRILSEDEVAASDSTASPSPTAPPEARAVSDGVLVLDPAMMVSKPPETIASAPVPEPEPEEADPVPVPVPRVEPAPAAIAPEALIAPEAAAVAASSVENLVRTIAAERTMRVHSGGPTIEDIVREELRPLLKDWLDANLPPMVERLVRVEIERVVGRVAP